MVVDLPRQWRNGIGAALLTGVALLLVFIVAGQERVEPAVLDATRLALPTRIAATTLGAVPAVQPRAAPPVAEAGTSEVQICGGQWLRTNADGSPVENQQIKSPQFPQERQRLADMLRADHRDVAQAAAIWIAMLDADRRRTATAKADDGAACTGLSCATLGPEGGEGVALLDQLARLALATNDPVVYAVAFNTCRKRASGACALLSAEQWTRVDPGNAVPWMHVLEDARTRRDVQGEAEALYQVSVAKRFDTREFAIPGLIAAIESAAPEGESDTVAVFELALETFGMAAAWAMPAYQHLTQACRADALRDANRRQTCEGIATTLSERSDTVLPTMIGISIGRRLDWPMERVAGRRGEYEAYLSSTSDETTNIEQMFACGGMRTFLARFERQGEIGEAAYMRQWAKASGKSPEEFERIGRASIARREAAAASAAASQTRI